MAERQYSDEEVAAIFKRAAEAQQTGQRQLPSSEGLTLAQLHEIGREVGLAPEQITQAAHAIDRVGRPTSRSFLGLPIGVGRTIDLGRRLSDDEWERLVVDLRETFDARGHLRQEGSFKQWTNGNLQALLEPTPTGHRIRLRTVKGDALSLIMGGLATFGIGAAIAMSVAIRFDATRAISSFTFVGLVGAAMFALGALRLPGWARRRRQQMEEIAARLSAGTSPPAHDAG